MVAKFMAIVTSRLPIDLKKVLVMYKMHGFKLYLIIFE